MGWGIGALAWTANSCLAAWQGETVDAFALALLALACSIGFTVERIAPHER